MIPLTVRTKIVVHMVFVSMVFANVNTAGLVIIVMFLIPVVELIAELMDNAKMGLVFAMNVGLAMLAKLLTLVVESTVAPTVNVTMVIASANTVILETDVNSKIRAVELNAVLTVSAPKVNAYVTNASQATTAKFKIFAAMSNVEIMETAMLIQDRASVIHVGVVPFVNLKTNVVISIAVITEIA